MTETNETQQGWQETPDDMEGLSQLARIAWEAWQEYAPTAFGMLRDPRTFFSRLGERAQEQESQLAAAMQGPDKPGESTMAKAGRIQQATNAAREQVIVEMCRPPADLMEDDNDDLDRLQTELLSPGVEYYLLPWIEEEPDPEEDPITYEDYQTMLWRKEEAQQEMANKEKEHERLVARCRELLGEDATPAS
ncbi:MAG: hypothetical protein R5N71_01005 [Cutibacterium granulosum]|uniref:hypothetical protein n=1 Tax=Cutibacterium granulosum TaxID=33011 RepID=UPI002B22298E|nr:hypothetical protein [Cutibacterium granulosum]MEA5648057.1 hypothetical protein [Cutibacterium granulosum]MEA5653309.1 hypothetical protein [Cutibacterium granulosum]MEA5662485.1 hypothetical protein [Cutibacterium granulosum]